MEYFAIYASNFDYILMGEGYNCQLASVLGKTVQNRGQGQDREFDEEQNPKLLQNSN